MLLMAAIAATRDICERKLQMPSVREWRTMPDFNRKADFESRMTLVCIKYQTARTAVTIWPNTVATAAPIIPHLKIKIKIGSNIMLIMAPASVETMANLGLPSARIAGLAACPNI